MESGDELVLVKEAAIAGAQVVRSVGPRTSFINSRFIADKRGARVVVGGIFVHLLGEDALVVLIVIPPVADG